MSDDLIIFDGGTGREIERQGGPFRQPEWSALALYEDPQIVKRVHESYLQAGATTITTNTYAVVPFHIGQERYERDAKRLLTLAVDLALQAAAASSQENARVIGSIPPICGSYEPDGFDETVAGPILDDFLNAFRGRVDGLLLETVGSIREARFYLRKIAETDANLPVWLSFCIESHYGLDQRPFLLTNETLTEAVEQLSKDNLLSQVDVILVNCCDVRIVSDAIQELSSCRLENIRIGAYPNAFSVPPPDAANHILRQVDFNITPEVMKQNAQEWVEHGATVLGGCCGVGPDHIRAMASLKKR